MPYLLNPKQYAAVCALHGEMRYAHFVSRVSDWSEVWGLRDEKGWVSLADEAGTRCIPVWPHPQYAEECANAEWKGNMPQSIEVHEFVENWLPGMEADGLKVAVFPTPKCVE